MLAVMSRVPLTLVTFMIVTNIQYIQDRQWAVRLQVGFLLIGYVIHNA